MAGNVPVAASLSDIYHPADLATQAERWDRLTTRFQALYGELPNFIARSPGRVNIIGEHIDYSLYSVLPMAIAADTLLAVSVLPFSDVNRDASDPSTKSVSFKLKLANVQETKFPAREFDVPSFADVEIDAAVHEWTNYFKSGLRGALELLRKKNTEEKFYPNGLLVLMDGTVPAGGGLSSSAAFVSASALAVMTANGAKKVDKKELTELAIVSERAVGVNSGGMDQSASVFSTAGSALFVSFAPTLAARPVHFPKTSPELAFVVAQSFVAADKHVTGPIHYNLRVVECSLAAAYLHAVLNPPGTQLPSDAAPLGISLHGFHETYFYHQNAKATGANDYSAAKTMSTEEELEHLLALTGQTLSKEDGYTREEIAAILETSVEALEERFMSKFPVRAEKFQLRKRAMHVFSEALRVLKFMALLEAPPTAEGGDTTELNVQLGKLLNETQDSCRDVYECSCPEIDELCRIARSAGAYGSRLTGAGWGGCSVHLVPVDKVDAVREAWEKEYYSKRNLTEEQRAGAVVVSRPGSGSAIYVVRENEDFRL